MENMFATKSTREKGCPLETRNDTPNKKTQDAFQELQQMKNDPKKKTYGSFAELLEEDARSPSETCYLSSNSQVKREIIEGMNTPLSACLPEDKVEW